MMMMMMTRKGMNGQSSVPRWSDFLIGRLVKIWEEEQRKYKKMKLDDVDEDDELGGEDDGKWCQNKCWL